MTAVQALYDPQVERLTSDFSLPSRIETEETETTPLEQYRRWCHEATERNRLSGLPDESSLTMGEIVAICKEVRAEMYEEEQKLANNR